MTASERNQVGTSPEALTLYENPLSLPDHTTCKTLPNSCISLCIPFS